MKRLFPIIAVSALLTSCATLLNGPTTAFTIRSAIPVDILSNAEIRTDSDYTMRNDPIPMINDVEYIATLWRDGPRFRYYTIETERSKKPLELEITDSTGTYILIRNHRLDPKSAWILIYPPIAP